MGDTKKFPLHAVIIDRDPEKRIDKLRGEKGTLSSLHPAELKDAGKPTRIVAKITYTGGQPSSAIEKRKECTEIHKSLHEHPFITKVVGSHQTKEKYILLMEEAVGSMRYIIQPSTPEAKALRAELLSKTSLQEVIRRLLEGLSYIHSNVDEVKNKISHRDIKPDNLLIHRLSRDGSLVIKYTDFDSAKQVDFDGKNPVTTGAFTAIYLAPEIMEAILRGKHLGASDYLAHDVFAVALVAFELRCGFHLYGADHVSIPHSIKTNSRAILIKANVDELFRNAIWAMTQPISIGRIPIEEAMKLPYFRSIQFHVDLVSAMSEYFIGLGNTKEARDILKAFNRRFFMLFKKPWKKFTFVVEKLLKNSKYQDTPDGLLRFDRNLLMHAGQNSQVLEEHFRCPVSQEFLLERILEETPCQLIYLYWFAKQFLLHVPELSKFTDSFPKECAVAYEEFISLQEANITNVEDLKEAVCPDVKEEFHDSEYWIQLHKRVHREVLQPLNNTKVDFQPLKETVADLERQKKKLEKSITDSKGYKTEEEIDAIKSDREKVEENLQIRWILDARTVIQQPKIFLEGKVEIHSVSMTKLLMLKYLSNPRLRLDD